MIKPDKIVTYKVVFRNGHFYTEEKDRLIFTEQKQYAITGGSKDFSIKDEMLEIPELRTPEELEKIVVNKHGKGNVIKMLPLGTKFRFHFGLGKRKKNVTENRYEFEGVFEEDVYLFKIKHGKIDTPDSWRIEDCVCSITKNSNGLIILSEPIKAKSPAAAFAMLIGTHFDRQRSTSIKVYDHFWVTLFVPGSLFPDERRISLTLGQLREKVLKENIERINEILQANEEKANDAVILK